MKKWNKALRLAGIICLIILASLGVGLGGAAPILPKNRARFLETAAKVELVEAKKNHLAGAESSAEIKD